MPKRKDIKKILVIGDLFLDIYSNYESYRNSPEVNVPVFLEIKGRHNNLVFKHRTPIVREDAQGEVLTDVVQPDQILSHAEDGSVRDQFEYDKPYNV